MRERRRRNGGGEDNLNHENKPERWREGGSYLTLLLLILFLRRRLVMEMIGNKLTIMINKVRNPITKLERSGKQSACGTFLIFHTFEYEGL